MLPELREVLRRLCCGHGWSYAALWRPDRCDSRLLMMEECYHEGEAADVVDAMCRKVHMVGEGTLGTAAVSGKHQWIYSDTCCIDSSPTSTDDNLDIWQVNAEWQHQFISGIKTIAIISLPSSGVVQFGSSQKISESPEFVDQVGSLFRNQEAVNDQFLDMETHKDLNLPDTHATLASLISHGNAYSSNNINFLRDHLATEQSTGPLLPSTFFSRGSYDGVDSHSIRADPRVLAMPMISSSTVVSKGFSNSISWESLFHLTNQYQAVDNEAQASISPNTRLQSAPSFPQNSCTNFNGSMWPKEVFSSPQLIETAIHRFPSMVRTKSSLSGPRVNEFRHSGGGDSSEPCRPHGSSSSSFPFFTSRSFSEEHSFVSELPEIFFNSSKDSTPEQSKLVDPKDGQLSGQIQSSDQPLEQLSDVLTMPTNENLLSIRFKPSGLADSESVGCPQSSEFLSMAADSISANIVNSMETGPKWKAHLPDTPTQLLSDNELFDGMELDLIPRISEQYQWNDIILPGGSGSCSNFTSISDCITGSIEGDAKGLYSESTHGQLLDAVVAGNAISSSSNRSAATNADSVACLNLKHQYPKITKPGDSQILRNPVPLVGQPTLSDMSLPEFGLDKIIQACPNEAFPKSSVSSWMDDSCSMNSGSSIINQSKKPEDAGKVVRKRARPGESTRPRPKDRQQIQDRVKELREIVPNCAKCSIDSLLDRTIKHMLFLQSLTKYADKIKQADEPKMIGDESGVVLKDNFSGGGGGATWAYEVAGQTMVCPILVEDLNPPGQMLVEMLCEDRGFFLEIADIIRGFGLTILKGVMEVHESKIWARFLVEANRDITRMDIFLSLVQLLQQTSCIQSGDQRLKTTSKGAPTFANSEQSPAAAVAASLTDRTH